MAIPILCKGNELINREHIKGEVLKFIGEEGIKLLTSDEWRDFTQFTDDVVRLDNNGQALMTRNNGNVNIKSLVEQHQDFNASVIKFARRLRFGKDTNGNDVTMEKLFGDLRNSHAHYIYPLCARIILMWAVEHMDNMKYREKYENKKPTYMTSAITDDPSSNFTNV